MARRSSSSPPTAPSQAKPEAAGPAAAAWPCLRVSRDGVVIDVSVVPGASRTELVGWHDGALRIRLAAPPVEGQANEALRRWLADQLGLARQHVTLLRGASSRRKQLALGLSEASVVAWLSARVPPP